MNLNPETQDLWFLPIVSNVWHLWKAGNQQSVCGLPWSLASNSFDARLTKPDSHACLYCAAQATKESSP